MKSIAAESATYLYKRIVELHRKPGLSYKEKIPKLRTLLEKLFKELTADEETLFPDLRSRMVFIQNQYDVPADFCRQIHGLRSYANRVVHEDHTQPGDREYLASLYWMTECVRVFSAQPVPAELAQLLSGYTTLELAPEREQTKEKIPYLQATVLDIGEVKRGPNSRQAHCSLRCDSQEYGLVTIVLRDLDKDCFGADISQLGSQLWKYAVIDVYNLTRAKNDPDVLLTTNESLVVMQPDYLVQATDIARCFLHDARNPQLDLIHRFIDSEPSTQLIQGALVNYLLDVFIQDPEQDFDTVFMHALHQQALDIICLLNSKNALAPEMVANFRQDVADHVPQLRHFARQVQGQIAFIEPTYNSIRYGLQGRLDVMLQDPERPEKKDIVELKGGRSASLQHKNGVKSDHAAQTHCYHLLLKSTFPNRIGNNAILYSGTPEGQPARRNVPCGLQDVLGVMMIRNQLVSYDHKMAAGDFSMLRDLLNGRVGTMPNWKLTSVDFFVNILKNASPLEQAYFKEYAAFITREKIIAKTGSDLDEVDNGYAALWQNSLEEKLDNYAILYKLEIDAEGSDFGQGYLRLLRRQELSRRIANFRQGDIAILYPVEPDGSLKPLSHQLLKCSIKQSGSDALVISLRNKQVQDAYFAQHPYWVLEHDYLESGVNSLYQSLFHFLQNTERRKRQVLLGLEPPQFDPSPGVVDDRLDARQLAVLNQALSAKDYFLLQGPPGTGKTSILLRNLVRHLHADPQESLILLAFTNRAVDEICVQMQHEGIDYLRLGFADPEQFTVLSRVLRDNTLEQTAAYLANVRVVVSTVSSFLSSFNKLRFRRFTTAIIDEASQLLDPHLAGICIGVNRFIMIGDEKQLPAVVTQNPSKTQVQNPALRAQGITDLRVSMFERLLSQCRRQGWHQANGMLATQGRMHQRIADFPSRLYYQGELLPATPRQHEQASLFLPTGECALFDQLCRERLAFVATEPEPYAKTHLQEAVTVARLVRLAAVQLGDRFNEYSIGVITPYRAQIAEIFHLLPPALQALVTIDTVERFQGSQRDLIIVSMSVNHSAQLRNLQAPTLDSTVDRKLNVTLTRARSHLWLLGCEQVLSQNFHYNQFISYTKDEGIYHRLNDVLGSF
ncbi:MAG: ATP-binding protein [Bacteroidetes bacterium]|nr:ATP-binding protein [Bacteroidota bacterium]